MILEFDIVLQYIYFHYVMCEWSRDTNDDGEIDIKSVVEHIKAVEAGSGKNTWVNQRLQELLEMEREVDHVELAEFLVEVTSLFLCL